MSARVPSYCLHRRTGQAVVTLPGKPRGRDVYLGRHGTEESKRRYREVVAEWLAGRGEAPPPAASTGPTVAEVADAYLAHAQGYYRKAGEPTSQVAIVQAAVRALKLAAGATPAAAFDAAALKAVRSRCLDLGLTRGGVNRRVRVIVGLFRWAVSEGLASESAWTACRSVPALKRGRTEAPESAGVGPVPIEDVDRTLPYLPRPVAAMVRLQLLTGMRPGEACVLRGCDLEDLDKRTWTYRPERHKTEHHGRDRAIPLGPQAQAVIRPFLKDPDAYLFSPREWMRERFGREGRFADRYGKDAYRNAVLRACGKAGVPSWHPNQLRHAYATDVRRRFGLEAAQVLLGHASADATQIYAERDAERAAAIAAEIG